MSDVKTSTTTTKKQDAGEPKVAPKAQPAKAEKSVFEQSLERGYYGQSAADKEAANGK